MLGVLGFIMGVGGFRVLGFFLGFITRVPLGGFGVEGCLGF